MAADGADASGNSALGDIGLHLKAAISAHSRRRAPS